MDICIENSNWVNIFYKDGNFHVSAIGTNGNTIFISKIKRKYVKQLYKDLKEILGK